MLHPDCTLRTDAGTGLRVVVGADAVAAQASSFASVMSAAVESRPRPGQRGRRRRRPLDGQPMSVLAFTVVEERIVEIDILADRDRLVALDLDLDALA